MLNHKNKRVQIGLIILLGAVFLLEGFATALAAILEIQQSPVLEILLPILLSTIITAWVHNDSQNYGTPFGLDQGAFIFIWWPITLPIYALKSRGFRSGILLSLAFFGIIVLSALIALLAAAAISLVITFAKAN